MSFETTEELSSRNLINPDIDTAVEIRLIETQIADIEARMAEAMHIFSQAYSRGDQEVAMLYFQQVCSLATKRENLQARLAEFSMSNLSVSESVETAQGLNLSEAYTEIQHCLQGFSLPDLHPDEKAQAENSYGQADMHSLLKSLQDYVSYHANAATLSQQDYALNQMAQIVYIVDLKKVEINLDRASTTPMNNVVPFSHHSVR